jgi:hypothetical protein
MRAKIAIGAIVVAVVLSMSVQSAVAQLPPLPPIEDTVEDVGGAVEDTVGAVGGAVGGATGAVGGAVGDTSDAVGGAVGSVGGAVGDTAGAVGGAVGGAAGAVGGAIGDATDGGGSGSGSGSGSVLRGVNDAISGGGTGGAAQGSTGALAGPGARARARGAEGAASATVRGGTARVARHSLSSGSVTGAAYLPLLLGLTNDADGDGTFSDSETAPLPGATVTFQAVLENVGSEDLIIVDVRNTAFDANGGSDDPVCTNLVTARLVAGHSVTCRFTVGDYAPRAGASAVNTLQVEAIEADDFNARATVTDTSIVATGTQAVLGLSVGGPAIDLATTGGRIALLLSVVAALAALGLVLDRLGVVTIRPRKAAPAQRTAWAMVPPPRTSSPTTNETAWPGVTARSGDRNSTRARSRPSGVTAAGHAPPRYRTTTSASKERSGRSGIQLTRSATSPRRARRSRGPTTMRFDRMSRSTT